jgi:protein involved in polysaccharide export with SLBB domain
MQRVSFRSCQPVAASRTTAWRARIQRTIATLALACAGACSSTATSGYSEIKTDVRSVIQSASLGPGDEFEVRVYEEPALSGQFVVSATGQVDYPLVGTITVEGLSASQVAELLRRRLKQGFLRSPYVVVQVKNLNSKKVFVLGEVKTPGRFQYAERMSIVEAVTLAGGFNALAEKNYTIVTRIDASGQHRIPVPVEKIMQGLSANFTLQPGDIVYVPETIM